MGRDGKKSVKSGKNESNLSKNAKNKNDGKNDHDLVKNGKNGGKLRLASALDTSQYTDLSAPVDSDLNTTKALVHELLTKGVADKGGDGKLKKHPQKQLVTTLQHTDIGLNDSTLSFEQSDVSYLQPMPNTATTTTTTTTNNNKLSHFRRDFDPRHRLTTSPRTGVLDRNRGIAANNNRLLPHRAPPPLPHHNHHHNHHQTPSPRLSHGRRHQSQYF
jgi:hypothetical protein